MPSDPSDIQAGRSLRERIVNDPIAKFAAFAIGGLLLTGVIGLAVGSPSWKLFRTLQVYWLIYLGLVASVVLPRLRQHWRDFFFTDETSINLGIARIMIFASVFARSDGLVRTVGSAMQRGPELFVPFKLLDTHVIWPSYEVISFMASTLEVSALLAMLGLFTRFTTIWTAVTLFLVLGTINSFGKVDHSHHTMWFALIIAASPSGASLSVDSLARSFARGLGGLPPARHLSYGLAMRALWLQIGLLYLSAGMPKWMTGGLQWFWSDSLLYTMHERWYMSRWIPSIRIDEYPLLVRFGGLGTLLVEFGVIILVIWGWRCRVFAGGAAYLFHESNGLFMNLRFGSLQSLLFVLMDWQRLLAWIGNRVFGAPLVVTVAAGDRISARLCAAGKAFDFFDTLRVEESADVEETRAVQGQNELVGGEALRAICMRSPILWPMLAIYRWLKPTRSNTKNFERLQPKARIGWTRGVATMLIIMTLGNAIFTLAREKKGWPFSAYPSFKQVRTTDTTFTTLIRIASASGQTVELPIWSLSTNKKIEGLERSAPIFSSNELRAYSQRMRDKKKSCGEALRIWSAMSKAFPDLADADQVDFFEVTVSIKPGRWDEELSRKHMLKLHSVREDEQGYVCERV